MVQHRRSLAVWTVAALFAVLWVAASTNRAAAQITLLNVSYDPTRELYRDINPLFVADWRGKGGEPAVIRMSHGGSGAQARSVIDGLDAAVVTLALASDIDAIAKATGKIPADWQQRLPNNSSPYTSTILFVVRKGNPKGIKDWDDLVKPGIKVVTPNPKTSGGARWNYLAAWGYALDQWKDEGKAREFMTALYRNVPVLDTGARGATTTFAQRGIGDVLIAWENEAFLVFKEFGADKFDLVVPSMSIRAEPPVALVDGNVDARGTRKGGAGLSRFPLPAGRRRPSWPSTSIGRSSRKAAAKEDIDRFPQLKLVSVDTFGGWGKVQEAHFSDGGVFDDIIRAARQ